MGHALLKRVALCFARIKAENNIQFLTKNNIYSQFKDKVPDVNEYAKC
jgi:hypothetical protein